MKRLEKRPKSRRERELNSQRESRDIELEKMERMDHPTMMELQVRPNTIALNMNLRRVMRMPELTEGEKLSLLVSPTLMMMRVMMRKFQRNNKNRRDTTPKKSRRGTTGSQLMNQKGKIKMKNTIDTTRRRNKNKERSLELEK